MHIDGPALMSQAKKFSRL